MSIGTPSEARRTGQWLDIEISAGLARLRTRVSGAAGADTLITRLDILDQRRAELLRRLDDMPAAGGGAGMQGGMASDTPLAGLADVLLRVQRLDETLGDDPGQTSVAAAERVAAEPLPRPVRLLGRQREVIERVRRGAAPA